MSQEPKLELLYLLANPMLGRAAQVAVTTDGDHPTLNTLDIHIQNPADSPVIEFENVDELEPGDEIPGIDKPYSGPRLDRLYLYFPWGATAGTLAPRELAASFTLSPALDNVSWWAQAMSDPKIGPYWVLYPRDEDVLAANQSVRFVLTGVQTTNPAESTTTLIVDNKVTGYRHAVDRRTPLLLLDAEPRITSFTATPEHVPAGGAVELAWTTWNASSVRLRPLEDPPPLEVNGSLEMLPTRTTTYQLEALGRRPGPGVKDTVVVTVEPVEIEKFSASPEVTVPGYPPELSWRTRSATAAEISPEIGSVPVTGSVRGLERLASTIYTLTAYGEQGPVERRLEVAVGDELRFSTAYAQGAEAARVFFALAVANASAGATVSLRLDPPLPGGQSGFEGAALAGGSRPQWVGFEADVPAGYEASVRYSYRPEGSVTSADLRLDFQARFIAVGASDAEPVRARREPATSPQPADEVSAAKAERWKDLYLRENLADHGTVPRSPPADHSPDIIPYGLLPIDDPTAFFAESYDRELGRSLVRDTPNYIYVRIKNLASRAKSGKLFLYYSSSASLYLAQYWIGNTLKTSGGADHLSFSDVAEGEVLAPEPFVLTPPRGDESLVLIARLVTPEHPGPVTYPPGFFNLWTLNQGGAARYDAPITRTGAASYHRAADFDAGSAGGRLVFALVCTRLPAGSEAWMSSGTPLAGGGTIKIPPSTIPEDVENIVFGTEAEVPEGFSTRFFLCYRGSALAPDASLELRVLLPTGETRVLTTITTHEKG